MTDQPTETVTIAVLVRRINAAIGIDCPSLMVTRQSIRDYCTKGTIAATRVPSLNPLSSKEYWHIPEEEASRVVQMFIDNCKKSLPPKGV